MKKYTKIGLIILSMVLFNTIFVYAESETQWPFRRSEKEINDLYEINKQEILEDSEFFKAHIEYPFLHIKNLNDREHEDSIKIIKDINDKIYKYVYKFKNQLEKESQKYKEDYEKEFEKLGYNKYKYDAYTDYSITYNKNNLLSIPITSYEFTGGAHGLTSVKSFNYDLLTGKKIILKDVFRDGVDYKKIINSYIVEDINNNKDLYFTGKDGFKSIKDNQEFYLDKNGLVVYFPLYEIAPYYVGIPKFIIPYKDIEPYLKIDIF